MSNDQRGDNGCLGSSGLVRQQRLPAATSVDSVRLWCDDVVLAPDFTPYANQFKIVNWPDARRRRVMLWRAAGEAVWGRSAVAISGGIVFRLVCINPCRPPQLSIWFSFPRWRWGHNASLVTQHDVANVIEDINERAASLGLSLDVARAKITELHLFRDIVVGRAFEDYLEILRAIEPPYSSRFKERETWILRGSKPSRWAIYDKGAEFAHRSQSRGENREAGILGLVACQKMLSRAGAVGLMRFEWRLLSARKILDQIGFNDLSSLGAADGLLQEKFDQALARDVFRWQPPEARVVEGWCDLQTRRDQAATRAHSLMLGPAKLEKVLAFEGWKGWVREFGLERANEILKSGSSAAERKRFKAHLRQMQHSTRMPCGLFWGELYGELARAAFCSAKLEKLPRLIPLPDGSSKRKIRRRKKQA